MSPALEVEVVFRASAYALTDDVIDQIRLADGVLAKVYAALECIAEEGWEIDTQKVERTFYPEAPDLAAPDSAHCTAARHWKCRGVAGGRWPSSQHQCRCECHERKARP